jgi:hypothetical protein
LTDLCKAPETAFLPSRQRTERLEGKSVVVLDVEEATGRPRLVAVLHVAPNSRNGLFVANNPINLRDPDGLQPGRRNNGSAWNDFKDQYDKMREANWKNSDKYFHCMANCEAAKKGHSKGAKDLSDLREWFDEHIKGDSKQDCDADQEANKHGREAGENGEDCKSACDKYRPDGLPDKY